MTMYSNNRRIALVVPILLEGTMLILEDFKVSRVGISWSLTSIFLLATGDIFDGSLSLSSHHQAIKLFLVQPDHSYLWGTVAWCTQNLYAVLKKEHVKKVWRKNFIMISKHLIESCFLYFFSKLFSRFVNECLHSPFFLAYLTCTW